MRLRIYTALLLVMLTISCQDVVDVDLNTAAPRLVIDASIDWVKGTDGSTQMIRLSKTTGYYATEIPTVSGATVSVTDGTTDYEFVESPGTGEYVCTDFVPVIGQTYTLTVVAEGQLYTATEMMFAAPDIEGVEQDNEGGFSGDAVELKFFFQDNPIEQNYYLTAFETNITAFPEWSTFDDEFFNGNQNFGYYVNDDLEAGDVVTFSLYGISRRYHEYMTILIDVSSGGGGPWGAPPSNVRGNVVNQTDSDNFALGYFRVAEVVRVEYVVE